jgi:hypothetical protein
MACQLHGQTAELQVPQGRAWQRRSCETIISQSPGVLICKLKA